MNEHVNENTDKQETNPSDHQKKYEGKSLTKEDLIDQLQNQVDYFDSLPQHERFSFATNAELYYFMLIVLNILKKGLT